MFRLDELEQAKEWPPAERPRSVLAVSNARTRVVIVGGGFGGLFCARQLRRAAVDVTLLDRTASHLFQPLLYQCATGKPSIGAYQPLCCARNSRYRNVTTLSAR